ncbi:hypothetical protein [Hymenobacter edaphi]|uniref:Uncharacterized protein n=1 Tax=Hymenobacter edaphi TaxID=2211146 RepID=A0A328BXX8_9BACT|nr:hypothetical protein [Hymenobacter edaphi]RAK69968.1 hypothetical protein DLM85_03695 [Hymenobacter edaphi]
MSQESVTTDALQRLISQLIGTQPWRSRAGSGTGSIFTLQFGEPLPANPREGAFSLMVFCAWHIVREEQIRLSWHDDPDQVLAPGLAALEGHTVTGAELSSWYDLVMRLSNGQELHILNDFSPRRAFDECWSIIHNGQQCHCVQPNGSIALTSVGSRTS